MNKIKFYYKNLIYYAISLIALVFADQFTKVLAVESLKGKNAFVLIKDVFEFSYLENTGAAWGMMSGARVFFIILTIVIVVLLTFFISMLPYGGRYTFYKVIISILSAGAIGNFIDRLFLGYVRDFIYFKLINFPIFNVADIYVTVSVILLVICILFIYKENDFDFLRLKKDMKNERNH